MISCPLCQSKKAELLYTNSRGNKYLENYICLNCGFVYVHPRISKKLVEELYLQGKFSSDARNLKTPNLEKYIQTEQWAMERIHFLEKQIPEFFGHKNNCLEIGCGTGSFSWLLRNRGQDIVGLEPDREFALAGQARYGIQIHPILFEEFQSDNKFDFVCNFHVIEHVVDPRQFLKDIYNILKDDGILFIECPTIDVIYTNDINSFFWDVHVNTFSNVTLPSLLESEGYRIYNKSINRGFLSILAKKSLNSSKYFLPDSPNRIKKIMQPYMTEKTEQRDSQETIYDKVFSKSVRVIRKIKKKLISTIQAHAPKSSIRDLQENNISNDSPLPVIYSRQCNPNLLITHVSAFSYGNAGDTLLPVALRDLWHKHQPEITWISQPIYQTVDMPLVEKINRSKGVVIGGGGLFLRDTNANAYSGWQWPCSVDILQKISVPIVLFAVGYNRFRGQDDFEPVFTENIREFAQKSVYLGLRNHGSIESIKQYLPENLHQKLVYQPCPTTFLKRLYPDIVDYNKKEDFFALNCAFDRPHLRFGQNVGKILSDIAIVCKEISKHLPMKFYSHMPSDQAILPFLQAHGIKYDLVELQNTHPRHIIEQYAKPKLVVGMRGHAQMVPFGCNTPIVSVISHNKMQWFLEDIGQPEWGADVLSVNFRDELLQRSLSILNNSESVMKYIDEKIESLYDISLDNVKTAINSILN